MTYETFKALYEIQLAIGKLIDVITKNQYGNDLVKSLISEAENIANEIGTQDAHWEQNPISAKEAWKSYIPF